MDMWDFRMFLRECIKLGQYEELVKILREENIIQSEERPQGEWIEMLLMNTIVIGVDTLPYGKKNPIIITRYRVDLSKLRCRYEREQMRNIASYQEGYVDGYDTKRERDKEMLNRFISEQMEIEPVNDYLKGYNQALRELKQIIEAL